MKIENKPINFEKETVSQENMLREMVEKSKISDIKVSIVCCYKCYDEDAKLLWVMDKIICEYCFKK